ncbi:unnamed protein product [Peniophora sp. CBMAI 1063]|nr:unnamed protein product [Peniophora sp. CBMAI 1063]
MAPSVLAAGSNAHGQLGSGDREDAHHFHSCLFYWDGESRARLPHYTTRVARIVGGANHTLLLTSTSDGIRELWGSGDNTRGQLWAPGSQEDTTTFRLLRVEHLALPGWRIKNVAAAWESSYFVLSDGRRDAILATGSNERCLLGHDGPDGAHLVDLSGLLDGVEFVVQDIVAGPMHVVALLHLPSESRTLAIGWGTARHGQLGQPIQKWWTHPRILSALPENASLASVALGNQHTILRHTDGRVTALGSSRVGQLDGVADLLDVGSVHCTWSGTYIRTIGDSSPALSTGKNDKGQLGRPTHDSSSPSLSPVILPATIGNNAIKDMACGSEHVVVLTRDGKVYGWGWNEHGNLGTGGVEDVPLPTLLWAPEEGASARSVWAGCGTTFIVIG